MSGVRTIARKELADHFTGIRFVLLLALVAMVAVITTHMAGTHIRDALSGEGQPRHVFLMLFTTTNGLFSLVQFVALFGPLLGLILGFDAVSRERSAGTLSKILAQPIYRDAVINGKFLAGVVVVAVALAAIFLLVAGLGMSSLGLIPSAEGVMRLVVFYVVSVFYVSLWLGLAILFSILLRGVATSAMATFSVWIFLTFFVPLGAFVVANAVSPPVQGGMLVRDAEARNYRIQRTVAMVSPTELYRSATAMVVNPWQKTASGEEALAMRWMNPYQRYTVERFQRPLPLGASLAVVWPYIVLLVATTLALFGISYAVFMRQEIRAG